MNLRKSSATKYKVSRDSFPKTLSMRQSFASTTGAVQPLVTPRIQSIREKISLKELELSLTRLGLATTTHTANPS